MLTPYLARTDVHHPQEDQARPQKGQDGRPQVLQGRQRRQDQAIEARVPDRDLRSWCLHGLAQRQAVLRKVRPYLQV